MSSPNISPMSSPRRLREIIKSKSKRLHGGNSKSKLNSTKTTSENVLHVVRMTITGLDGVVRHNHQGGSQNSKSTKDSNKVVDIKKLRAFISLSHDSKSWSHCSSNLSDQLCRSRKHSVTETASTHEDFEISHTNLLQGKEEQYSAVWSNEEKCYQDDDSPDEISVQVENNVTSLDQNCLHSNVITFETNLRRTEINKSGSGFAPKSFELNVGLAADASSDWDEEKMYFGVPLGVATLVINGDESNAHLPSKHLELPILSLLPSLPTFGDSAGHVRLPQKREQRTLVPLETEGAGGDAKTNIFEQHVKKEKRNWFLKNKKHSRRIDRRSAKNCRVPTSKQEDAFRSTYSIGLINKAVVDITIEVYAKGSLQEKEAKKDRQQQRLRAKKIIVETQAAAEAQKENELTAAELALREMLQKEHELNAAELALREILAIDTQSVMDFEDSDSDSGSVSYFSGDSYSSCSSNDSSNYTESTAESTHSIHSTNTGISSMTGFTDIPRLTDIPSAIDRNKIPCVFSEKGEMVDGLSIANAYKNLNKDSAEIQSIMQTMSDSDSDNDGDDEEYVNNHRENVNGSQGNVNDHKESMKDCKEILNGMDPSDKKYSLFQNLFSCKGSEICSNQSQVMKNNSSSPKNTKDSTTNCTNVSIRWI